MNLICILAPFFSSPKNRRPKNWLYPDFSNVHFLVYTIVSEDSSISYDSKIAWDLCEYIKIAHHEKNDVRKGTRCSKKMLVAWTWNLSRPSPSGAPLRYAALTDSPYHAEPEGADGERTPTFYLWLKNYMWGEIVPENRWEIRIDPTFSLYACFSI